MSELPASKDDLCDRLRNPYRVGQLELRCEAADEIARLQHDLERAMANHVADLNAPKPAHEREPPHCSTCECGAQPPNDGLAVHLASMCGWAETLASKAGWFRENAASFWSSYDAARAASKQSQAHETNEPLPGCRHGAEDICANCKS